MLNSFSESLCTSKKNQDRCLELIAECIFLEKKSDLRKSTTIGLNVFQEFQLVIAFAEFFSRPGPDVTRNAVFLSLFGNTVLPAGRSRVLSKFISTAISDSIAPVSFYICRTQMNISFFLCFLFSRFYVQPVHGCNKLAQAHCHAWNWHSD